MLAEIGIAELLLAIASGGALVAVITGLFQRGKVKSERATLEAQADEYLSKATKTIVESWEATNKALKDDLLRTKDELRQTKDELSQASLALRQATLEVTKSNRRFDLMLTELRKMNVDVGKILTTVEHVEN